jgi:hypothetical protein
VDENGVDAVAKEIDLVVLDVLGPLRTSKTVNDAAHARLEAAVDRLGVLLESESLVPKNVVGSLWFIFTSMLAEAEHARDPKQREKIERTAWDFAERLRRIFGPKF